MAFWDELRLTWHWGGNPWNIEDLNIGHLSALYVSAIPDLYYNGDSDTRYVRIPDFYFSGIQLVQTCMIGVGPSEFKNGIQMSVHL